MGSLLVPPSSKVITYRCFDTIHIGFYVDWKGSRILEKMLHAKQNAQEKFEPIPFDIGGAISAIIHPNGKKGGYRYHIQVGDINLFFSSHAVDSETPNVFVEIGSLSLHELGLNTIEERLESWISLLGGFIDRQKLSRVEMAADLIGVDIAIIGIDQSLSWITRASDTAVHQCNRKVNSVRAGAGDLILRIYDKRLEMTRKKASAKEELFNSLWNDTNSPVTRVEFQIRKRILKRMAITSITELFTRSNSLWEYLSHEWFRIADHIVNRNNTEDARIHPFWKVVQQVTWHGFTSIQRAKKVIRRNIDQLMKQGIGCLESVAIAMRRTADRDTTEVVIKQEVKQFLRNFKDTPNEIRKRSVKLAECIEFDVVPF